MSVFEHRWFQNDEEKSVATCKRKSHRVCPRFAYLV